MSRFGALRESLVTVEDTTTSFAEWGDPEGAVVVGWPATPALGSVSGGRGSTHPIVAYAPVLRSPGFGRSSPDPPRTGRQLHEGSAKQSPTLGSNRAVLGNSSGGPYDLVSSRIRRADMELRYPGPLLIVDPLHHAMTSRSDRTRSRRVIP